MSIWGQSLTLLNCLSLPLLLTQWTEFYLASNLRWAFSKVDITLFYCDHSLRFPWALPRLVQWNEAAITAKIAKLCVFMSAVISMCVWVLNLHRCIAGIWGANIFMRKNICEYKVLLAICWIRRHMFPLDRWMCRRRSKMARSSSNGMM